MQMNTPLLITFSIYILGMIAIGLFAYFSTQDFDDYILGGRKMGSFVTALSAGASDMSAWLLMGLPGAIYLFGLCKMWIAIGLSLGSYLNWKFVAGRLRVHTEINDNALTLPDYFTSRFDDQQQLLRLISAVVILLFFTIYCASGIVAGAQLFESTFGFTYQQALWLGAFATITYTFIGGFLAVSWTDTVQALLMLFALILTPLVIIKTVGGVSPALNLTQTAIPNALSVFSGIDTVSVISLLGWGLGYIGQPHILARFMAADSASTLITARRISMTWMLLCLIGAVSIGFFGIAYFQQYPQHAASVDANSERIFIELTKLLFNPWVAGVLLSAILAAVMSTLSCQLLVSASAITEDIYKSFFRKQASEKELVWVGRFMVLVVSAVAMVLAQNPNSRILGLVSYAWAGFGAAFGPVILLSVFWQRMTRNGALMGMIVGTLTVLIWKHCGWQALYEIIPGFAFSCIAIVITSLMDASPSTRMQAYFKKANDNLAE